MGLRLLALAVQAMPEVRGRWAIPIAVPGRVASLPTLRRHRKEGAHRTQAPRSDRYRTTKLGQSADSGELDGACALVRAAIDYAAGTTSFRSAHRITMMLAELHPHVAAPIVRDVNDYARTVLADAPVTLADLPG